MKAEMNAHRPVRDAERVVITGVGAITPVGNDASTTWNALIAGKCGIAPITEFDAGNLPVRIAACVRGFDAARYMEPREARRLSPFIHYAIAAAGQAVAASGLVFAEEDPLRTGVTLGSALGGTGMIEEQRLILSAPDKGYRHVNPTMLPAVLITSAACQVAIRYGIKGPVSVPVAACATGVAAIGEAARSLAMGEIDLAIAGGTDSAMTSLSIAAFARLGALSTRNDDPARACMPFDAGRSGTVVGEGAAVVVMETLTHAVRRGAPILAEVLGYGFTCDALHLVAPDSEGDGAARAMVQALRFGGVPPGEIDWICAHGTGTPLNDAAETRAIKRALGEAAYRTPVSSLKGSLGHMLGAAGAVSAVTAVQAMQFGLIPPTVNYETPDPQCDLDYVPRDPRPALVNTVMVNAFGFGGQNACLLLRRDRATV
jgi:3-oxoacyl-[acyl-carrier-protein] synthase II